MGACLQNLKARIRRTILWVCAYPAQPARLLMTLLTGLLVPCYNSLLTLVMPATLCQTCMLCGKPDRAHCARLEAGLVARPEHAPGLAAAHEPLPAQHCGARRGSVCRGRLGGPARGRPGALPAEALRALQGGHYVKLQQCTFPSMYCEQVLSPVAHVASSFSESGWAGMHVACQGLPMRKPYGCCKARN